MSDRSHEPTNGEILEFLKTLNARFDSIDSRFDAGDLRFDSIDSRFNAIDLRFNAVDLRFDAGDLRFDAVDSRLSSLEKTMEEMVEIVTFIKDNAAMREEVVTKEYLKECLAKELSKFPTKYDLDDKLGDLKGDLVVLMRKEDRKVGTLVERLETHGSLPKQDARDILAMEPFPQVGK